jgi:hypothetical protein
MAQEGISGWLLWTRKWNAGAVLVPWLTIRYCCCRKLFSLFRPFFFFLFCDLEKRASFAHCQSVLSHISVPQRDKRGAKDEWQTVVSLEHRTCSGRNLLHSALHEVL